jgi:hypothetical protein
VPERIIPWRRAAYDLGGEATAKTGVRSSRYALVASRDGMKISATGHSVPFGTGWTEVEVSGTHRLKWLRLTRESATVLARLFSRDVVVGARAFDVQWYIRSRSDVGAQALLGSAVIDAISAVPDVTIELPYGEQLIRSYEFEVGGRIVRARTLGFEQEASRLRAVIDACCAIARQPERLLQEWASLAAELSGRFESSDRWATDGTTRIKLSVAGAPTLVAPAVCRLGKRARLRTRVAVEGVGTSSRSSFHLINDKHWAAPRAARGAREVDGVAGMAAFTVELEDPPEVDAVVREALEVARPVSVQVSPRQVVVDFDGTMLEVERLRAAAGAAVALARRGQTGSGPYR